MIYLYNRKIFGVTSLRSTGVWGVLSSFAVHFKRSLSASVGDPEATENCKQSTGILVAWSKLGFFKPKT